jgi:hypothetical protein
MRVEVGGRDRVGERLGDASGQESDAEPTPTREHEHVERPRERDAAECPQEEDRRKHDRDRVQHRRQGAEQPEGEVGVGERSRRAVAQIGLQELRQRAQRQTIVDATGGDQHSAGRDRHCPGRLGDDRECGNDQQHGPYDTQEERPVPYASAGDRRRVPHGISLSNIDVIEQRYARGGFPARQSPSGLCASDLPNERADSCSWVPAGGLRWFGAGRLAA